MAPEQKYFDFKTILLLKFYLTGHAESYCHLQHQEHNGRSSVTDKRHLLGIRFSTTAVFVTISEPNRSGAFFTCTTGNFKKFNLTD